jgi:hypothetical protein
MRNKVSSHLRKAVSVRADGFCEYSCANSRFADSPFEIEHIHPVSAGGDDDIENLALSCRGCNIRKSSRTLIFDDVDRKMVRLFNPRQDVWKEHFVWTSDFTLIESLTPIGRVTLITLSLNRDGLVNIRRILNNEGLHPPEWTR